MSKNSSQTLTDLRWVVKDCLRQYGITGRFFIEQIPDGPDGNNEFVFRLRNPRDQFIYELHGGDRVIWPQVFSRFAELRKRRWSNDR
jgi:hypothetical protein